MMQLPRPWVLGSSMKLLARLQLPLRFPQLLLDELI